MEKRERPRKRVSCLGRITVGLTILVAAFWVIGPLVTLLLHEKPPQEMEDIPWTEYVAAAAVVSVNVVALLWALWRPLGGGIALIVCSLLFAVFLSWPPWVTIPAEGLRDMILVFAIGPGPFMVVGILSVVRGLRARKMGTSSEESVRP